MRRIALGVAVAAAVTSAYAQIGPPFVSCDESAQRLNELPAELFKGEHFLEGLQGGGVPKSDPRVHKVVETMIAVIWGMSKVAADYKANDCHSAAVETVSTPDGGMLEKTILTNTQIMLINRTFNLKLPSVESAETYRLIPSYSPPPPSPAYAGPIK
jgi:hypothetical protein